MCFLCSLYFYLVNFVDLFYPDGAVIYTAWNNLLNEIEIKRYSLPSLMGNPDLCATVTDVMAVLQSIDYRKFQRFYNVVDEVSTKLLSSFWILIWIFKNICWKKTPNRGLNSYSGNLNYFKVILEIRTIKPTWWNAFSKNGE